MAKTSYINIDPSLEGAFYGGVQPGDRFTFARVIRKNLLLSRTQKIKLAGRSLFSIIADVWRGLSTVTKGLWSTAADEVGLSGWQLFVSDYAARLANGLEGVTTPSTLHQARFGNLHIESPANEAKISQLHPRSYYVKQKVAGKKNMYSPILVTEDLSLPFILGLNYKTNLSASGADPYAKLYARFWYSYQGRNLEQDLVIDLDLVTNWKNAENTLTTLETIIVRYDLYIHLFYFLSLYINSYHNFY